ncbi:MAG: (2Fe-2S)-binding protein [Chlamydiae bacterium]|nr:(2Fe-2S)-binding protein [Chlamydiota bacterium]MBI3276834.1 (2Fe-2S)-binding protein [Chlamydiota bacterium]
MKRITLGSLVKPELRSTIPMQDEFCFCSSPACDVVYFSKERILYRKQDLSVPVSMKEPSHLNLPICYCFGWTRERIQAEIDATGKNTVIEKIKAQVKIGNCYCEITNPEGSCCLGHVSQVALRREAK